jgi:TusA-related sulfurtransferase
MSQKIVIDARGAYCPGPLMELVKTIKENTIGTVVELLSSDEGSIVDIPKWVEKANHKMVEIIEDDGFRHFVVEIGEKKQRRRRR